ncbi:unnamed protein product, partial [Mesorhabditis belari]|uniref:G protein-coupled receptor n=1 Tax=Mesorhabditis belari TaxID=2138241 RepID=A0AAF3EMH7_9BILA
MGKYRYFNDSLLLEIYALYKGPDVLRLDAECAEGNNPHPKNIFQGSIYLTVGSFFVTLYALCLVAMAQQKFMKIICYRILFVVGLVDVFSLVPSSILPGYFLVMGYSFCDSPLLNLWIATLCFADWCVYCALSVVLALNRCVDFIGPQLQQTLFGGWRLTLWLLPPFIYGAIVYFTCPPLVYLTPTASYYFAAKPEHSIMPMIFLYNNVGVAICILFLNSLMLILMYRAHRKMNANTNKIQTVIAIQCFGICTTVMITGVFYCTIASGWIELPPIMYLVTNGSWQFSNSSMAIFYMHYEQDLKLLRERLPQRIDIFEFLIKDAAGQIEFIFGKEKIVCTLESTRTTIDEKMRIIATFLGSDLAIARLIFDALGEMFRTRILVLPNHIHSNPILPLLQKTNFFIFSSLLVLQHDWTIFEYLCQQLNSLETLPKKVLITDLMCDCSKKQKNFAVCIQCLTKVLRIDQIIRRDSVILTSKEVSTEDVAKFSLTPERTMWPEANFVVHLVKWMARPCIEPSAIRPRLVGLRFRDYTAQFQKRLVIGFDAIKMLSKDGFEIYRWAAPFDFYYVVVKDLEYVAVIRDFEMNIEKIVADTQEMFELSEMAILRD